MSKLSVIASRDFTTRARGGAYIVTTVLGVLILIAMAFMPAIVQRIRRSFDSEALEMYVVDNTGIAYPLLAEVVEEMGTSASVRGELLEQGELPSTDDPAFSNEAANLILSGDKDGILVVNEARDQQHSPFAFTVILKNASNILTNDAVQSFLNSVVRKANAKRLNMTSEELAMLWASAPVSFQELRVDEGQDASVEEVSERERAMSMVLAYTLLFILYMAMILYGNMIASGVAEEKSSRIMEIMVSTVKPIELMTAKIIGVGALGLLQFGIWIAAGLGLNALNKSGVLQGALFGAIDVGEIPPGLLIWFGLYFVLGFVLYAALFAAAGASVSRVEEVNQVSTMITLLLAAAFIVAYYSFLNPNGSLSVVCSMIPWLSPMVMFTRIALSSPPATEIVVSLVLLAAAIVLSAWVAARIYRVGVLMYGKRPSIKEMLKYVREP